MIKKLLQKYAGTTNLENFCQYSGVLLPYLSLASLALVAWGICWGLIYAPIDYQQGETYRIIYLHVPSAFLSLSVYSFMTICAVSYLIWRIKLFGLMLKPCALVGATLTAIALFTGAIWGKPMWGTYWVWDARLTSELILLILYVAVLAVYGFQVDHKRAAFVTSIIVLVGFVDIPIIHYSVYWWNTLHQGATVSVFTESKIANSMLQPLVLNICAFGLTTIVFIMVLTRNNILSFESQKKWVAKLMRQ